jgi:hypothetical protein
MIEAGPDGEAEARRVRRPHATDTRVLGREKLDDASGTVRARVVDDEHLIVDCLALKYGRDLSNRAGDGVDLVVSGDDDRELQAATVQWSTFRS